MGWKEPDFSKLPVKIARCSGAMGSVTVEVDAANVAVKSVNLSVRGYWTEPVSSFTEPVSSFTGVYRGGVLKIEEGTISREFYVELLHPDPSKNVTLYRAFQLPKANRVWKEAALSLKLAAIEDTPIGQITRVPSELEMPLGNLLIEKKIPLDSGIATHPPSNVAIRRGARKVSVIFRSHKDAALVFGSLTLIVGALLEFFGGPASVELCIFGVVLIGAAFQSRHIVVTPADVTSFRKTAVGNFSTETIPLEELQSVVLAEGQFRSGGRVQMLTLASDRKEVSVQLDSKEFADWLGQFVMAAAAGQFLEQ